MEFFKIYFVMLYIIVSPLFCWFKSLFKHMLNIYILYEAKNMEVLFPFI